ncbi:hypothetical protein CAEBREN_30318 [Caenorhabditis brenneri]|uniref:Uncharacterized protein n=1 Tax=Caenorhabditis brenneri TaxID=135651 RepID=G0ML83_CAEBE|nr:hypothetical protein CAEBREN_30318 [Caenorhabditis brenneri]
MERYCSHQATRLGVRKKWRANGTSGGGGGGGLSAFAKMKLQPVNISHTFQENLIRKLIFRYSEICLKIKNLVDSLKHD